MKISIVIPVYNEEENISLIYKRLDVLFTNREEELEIIFVNDGSKDSSLDLIRSLCEKDLRVKYIDFSRNFGHQNAITAGYDHAEGDAVISMDCDLQDPPEVIPEMLEKWYEGYEVVLGRRKKRDDPKLKTILTRIHYSLFTRVAKIRIPSDVADFRLLDKKVVLTLRRMRESNRYLRGMVSWLGFRTAFVDFERPSRENGTAKYSFAKLVKLAMDGFMSFSLGPIRIAMYCGMLTMSASAAGFLVQIVRLFGDAPVSLNSFILLAICFGMGLQFFVLWALGEYIYRIKSEINHRPLYVVKEKGNFSSNIEYVEPLSGRENVLAPHAVNYNKFFRHYPGGMDDASGI